MSWTNHVLPILISTFIGWITVWIIIKLLFYPRRPIIILKFKIQGFFPKRQHTIAQKLAKAVAAEFLSLATIETTVTHSNNFQQLKPVIEAHIDKFLREKLSSLFPMLSSFIGDKTINQLKEAFLMELEQIFPELMKNYIASLTIEQRITDKLIHLPTEQLERMLAKECRGLQVLGALIGLVIGVLQIIILSITT